VATLSTQKATSLFFINRLSDNGCQVSPSCDSVATEAGCQDINLSSVGMQCDIVDEVCTTVVILSCQ